MTFSLHFFISELVPMRERLNDPCCQILNKSIKDIENKIEGKTDIFNLISSDFFSKTT